MKDEKGVFAVARSIWEDGDFPNEPFTEREAWLWLLGKAAWRDGKVRGNTGNPVDLKRAEFSVALRFAASKWQWTKDRVHRFFKRLEKRDMIRDSSRDGHQIYIVLNYNEYQVVGLPNRDADRDEDATEARQHRDKVEALETLNITVLHPKPVPRVTSRQLPEWLDQDAWGAFLEMRRRKRAPVTERAVKNILGKLDRWRLSGHDPTAILDASTTSAWTDVYEPKAPHGNRNKQPSSNQNFLAGVGDYLGELAEGQESGDSGSSDEAGRPLLSA